MEDHRLHSEQIQRLKQKGDCRLSYLQWALEVALESGKKVKRAFAEHKDVSCKDGASDLVTKTDQEVEKFIITRMKETFPAHKFIGEESVASGSNCVLTDDPTWIVDPVDGTTNFVHRFPFVAVSIGLAIKQKMEVGVIYNPILDDLYYAVNGEGSYHNLEKIEVSKVNDLSSSLLMSEWGSDRNPDVLLTKSENKRKAIGTAPAAAHGLRSLGSCALNMCLIASGSADGYFEWGIHCWDMAAGLVIVEEAGGVVLDGQGKKLDLMARNLICASCVNLGKQIAERLVPIDLPRD